MLLGMMEDGAENLPFQLHFINILEKGRRATGLKVMDFEGHIRGGF